MQKEAQRTEISDWARENARGAAFANEVVGKIHSQGNPAYLGRVVQQMIKKGEFSGFEVGFFHHLSSRLV